MWIVHCRPELAQRLLTLCVSIWTESHKIWNIWRNLTKSAKFEPLLTRSSHRVFLLTVYGWVKSSIQPISVSRSILISRHHSINFVQSERRISSWHFLFFYTPLLNSTHFFWLTWEKVVIQRSEKPEIYLTT